MIEILTMLAVLDTSAVKNCTHLTHPERELSIALDIDGKPEAVEERSRLSRGVVYTRLAVPADTAALCHSHPSDGGAIVPGPGDWKSIVEGRPGYISHKGRLIGLYLTGGRYYLRRLAGDFSTREVRELGRSLRRANRKLRV